MLRPILFELLLGAALAAGTTQPKCTGATFKDPKIPGTELLSIIAEERHNVTSIPLLPGFPQASGLNLCEVKLYLTHPGADDKVLVRTWLPLHREDWNGRFLGTGGGAWATGFDETLLGPGVEAGYAVSETDGGHYTNPLDASWAVNPDGSVNWALLRNFATRSLADQVRVGKSVAEQFFGEKPHHSYWTGCSQGGRQGYAIAQTYPDLLDGINAYAPAIDLVHLAMGSYWPQLVMQEADSLMSQCEFSAFLTQTIEECDILDGVRDGIIEDPEACTFNPDTLVGQKIHCEGEDIEITQKMADVVRNIHHGPQSALGHDLWHGYTHGTPLDGVAKVTTNAEGVRSPVPFGMGTSFIHNLLLKDPSYNLSTLSHSQYLGLWAYADEQYGWMLSTENPDLTAFKDAGGKLLTWHGINDEVIPYQNTVQYRARVEFEMGGSKAVNEFYRVFLAPGVLHCGQGAGPKPKDSLDVLVQWVEEGEPPETLEAETENWKGERITRALCPYPKKTKYMGVGDGFRASSWSCEGGEDDEEFNEETDDRDFVGGLKDRLSQLGLDMGLRIG
jgi:hypothetical protein